MTYTCLLYSNHPHDRQLASEGTSATPVFADTTIEDTQDPDEGVDPPDTDEVVVIGEEKGLQVGSRVSRGMGMCAGMILDVCVLGI